MKKRCLPIMKEILFFTDRLLCLSMREEGKREGIEIGIQQGIKECIEKGIEKTKISMAINMKRDKVDLNTISKYTGLSIEEIKKL